MKKFKFSLQTVHDLRASTRDKAEGELARAHAEVAHAEAAVDHAHYMRNREADAIANAYNTGTIDPREAAHRFGYLELLAKHEIQARERLHSLERDRERVRETVTRAARDAEVTNKLRDRHMARHRAEVTRTEQISLDELVMLVGARRQMEGKA